MSEAPALSPPPLQLRVRRAAGHAYVECGGGEPLVLIHGVGMNKRAWYPQILGLSRRFRVIAVDMPGHGDSDLIEADAELSDYIHWICEFLDVLALGNVNLIGHSMGGLVAIGAALAPGGRVSRVAALNTVYDRDSRSRDAVEKRAREIARLGPAHDMDTALTRWFGQGDEHAEHVRQVRNWLQSVNGQGYATAYRVFASSDRAFVGRLGELSVPALFMTGEFDPNSTPEMSHSMAAACPKGRVLVLPGQRHVMNLVAPALVNSALCEFLETPLSPVDPPPDEETAAGRGH